MNGFIKIHRKLLEWEWFSDSHTLHVFMFLLLKSNWKDTSWNGIALLPGQLVTSVKSICEATSLTPRSVRTCINRLKSTSTITTKTTNKYTLITIDKWASYQIEDDETTNKTTSIATNERQTNDKQTTTAKEYIRKKEVKNKEEGKFNAFWESYPKKVSKPVALKAWNKINPDDCLLDTIMKALEKQKTWQQWTKDNGQYIPNPATWLNQEKWNDKPPELSLLDLTQSDMDALKGWNRNG